MPPMLSPAFAPCAVVLNQQQQENIRYHNQCNGNLGKTYKNITKNCTVVESGRVVVKPLQEVEVGEDPE